MTRVRSFLSGLTIAPTASSVGFYGHRMSQVIEVEKNKRNRQIELSVHHSTNGASVWFAWCFLHLHFSLPLFSIQSILCLLPILAVTSVQFAEKEISSHIGMSGILSWTFFPSLSLTSFLVPCNKPVQTQGELIKGFCSLPFFSLRAIWMYACFRVLCPKVTWMALDVAWPCHQWPQVCCVVTLNNASKLFTHLGVYGEGEKGKEGERCFAWIYPKLLSDEKELFTRHHKLYFVCVCVFPHCHQLNLLSHLPSLARRSTFKQ